MMEKLQPKFRYSQQDAKKTCTYVIYNNPAKQIAVPEPSTM